MGWNGKHLSVKHSFDAIQLIKGPKGHFDIANLEMLLNHFFILRFVKFLRQMEMIWVL